ncbi:hypothetical protein ACZ91_49845 [Streptomyces regensis]|nr:hypothetical protein ACZ91_49845 [Streptomyces regensis]
MNKTIARVIAGAALAGAAAVTGLGAGVAAAAPGDGADDVAVVDEPDTSDLHRHTLSGPGAGTEEKGGFRMHGPENALLPCGTPVPGGRLPTDVGRCSSAQNEGPVRPGGGLTGR